MRKLRSLFLALSLLLVSFFLGAIETDYYVDPGSAPGGDGSNWALAYDSLQDAITGLAKDLDTANEQMIIHLRATGGTADTTAASADGFTTSVTDYYTIQVDPADRANTGIYSTDHYRIELSSSASNALDILDNHVRVYGLQLKPDTGMGLRVANVDAGSAIYLSHLIVQGNASSNHGINSVDADSTIYIWDTLVYNITQNFRSAYIIENGTTNIYNSTAVDSYYGYRETGGTLALYMALASDCTDDYNGTIDGDHNASTNADAPGTNAHNVTRGVEFEFVNYAGDNFNIDASFDGTTDASGGLVTDGIRGNARSGTFDIGMDEYGAAAGSDTSPLESPVFDSKIFGIVLTIILIFPLGLFLLSRRQRK